MPYYRHLAHVYAIIDTLPIRIHWIGPIKLRGTMWAAGEIVPGIYLLVGRIGLLGPMTRLGWMGVIGGMFEVSCAITITLPIVNRMRDARIPDIMREHPLPGAYMLWVEYDHGNFSDWYDAEPVRSGNPSWPNYRRYQSLEEAQAACDKAIARIVNSRGGARGMERLWHGEAGIPTVIVRCS